MVLAMAVVVEIDLPCDAALHAEAALKPGVERLIGLA